MTERDKDRLGVLACIGIIALCIIAVWVHLIWSLMS